MCHMRPELSLHASDKKKAEVLPQLPETHTARKYHRYTAVRSVYAQRYSLRAGDQLEVEQVSSPGKRADDGDEN